MTQVLEFCDTSRIEIEDVFGNKPTELQMEKWKKLVEQHGEETDEIDLIQFNDWIGNHRESCINFIKENLE